MFDDLKKEVAKYSNMAYQRGLVGAAGGNVSARHDNLFLITAGGKSLRDVTEDDILTVDENSQIIEGAKGQKPSKETSLHLAIYKNRPDIDCVIHVHPSYCTAYSITKKTVPIITASSKLKLKKVPLVGYADPGSSELALAVAECVRENPEYVKAITLEAHGLLAWDKGLAGCFDIAELVEETARVAFISGQLGEESKNPGIYDLSLKISNELPTYPGDPVINITQPIKYKEKGINILSICMGTHSGTHIDVPLHHIDGGASLDQINLERFIGNALFAEIIKNENEQITAEELKKLDLKQGDILIIRTGWETKSYKNNYFRDFPYFSVSAADYLISMGIKAIGVDIPSVDGPGQEGAFHKKILLAGIVIIEALVNLNIVLNGQSSKRMFFSALPLNILNADGSPVRAIAWQ